MQTTLLNTGYACLVNQANAPTNKIQFTRFEVGSSVGFVTGVNIAHAQEKFFDGNASKMRYSNMSGNEAMVWCHVSHDDPTNVIGNIVIFASLNGSEYPFVLLRPDPASISNVKLKTSVHRAGVEYDLHFVMNIPNLALRFDFTNLIQETIGWMQIATDVDTPVEYTSAHDQVVIDNLIERDRPAFLVNIGNIWYGTSNTFRLDDPDISTVSGGDRGDAYNYTNHYLRRF